MEKNSNISHPLTRASSSYPKELALSLRMWPSQTILAQHHSRSVFVLLYYDGQPSLPSLPPLIQLSFEQEKEKGLKRLYGRVFMWQLGRLGVQDTGEKLEFLKRNPFASGIRAADQWYG
jgi:hypothetical protein